MFQSDGSCETLHDRETVMRKKDNSAATESTGEALRELRLVLDHAGVGIAFIKQRTVVRCNQHFADIYGFGGPADVIGQTSQSLYPHADAFHDLGAAAYPVMATGSAYKGEVLMKRRNKRLRTRTSGRH